MFPAFGFLFGARKTILNNRDELHAFITTTFINHLRNLDKNNQRSFIDTFLIQQQEVMELFKCGTEKDRAQTEFLLLSSEDAGHRDW